MRSFTRIVILKVNLFFQNKRFVPPNRESVGHHGRLQVRRSSHGIQGCRGNHVQVRKYIFFFGNC